MYHVVFVPHPDSRKNGHVHTEKTFEGAIGIWEYKRRYGMDQPEADWIEEVLSRKGEVYIEYLNDKEGTLVLVKG